MYLGDILLGATIGGKFTTRQASGVPTTLAGTPVLSAYAAGSSSPITAGITLTVDFPKTGLNDWVLVATGANGYAIGTNYDVAITTGTVNGVSVVGEVIGSFSIQNRAPQSYEKGAVWVDTTSGTNGTTLGVHGTQMVPTSTIANATTLLASTGLRNLYINERSSITLDASHTNQEFLGTEWTLDLNGKNIGNTRFNGCTVSGTSTGSGWTMVDAHVNNVTMAPGDINDSDMQGTFTLQATGNYSIHHCRGDSSGPFVVDYDALGACFVDLDDFWGQVTVKNMAAGDTFHCSGAGDVIIDATCTAGTVNINGAFTLTNNGSGQTINQNSRLSLEQVYSADVKKMNGATVNGDGTAGNLWRG